MAKYKLKWDYPFYTKTNNVLQNKIKGDRIIGQVIIDDKEHNIKGQEHKLNIIIEKKPEVQVDPGKQNGQAGSGFNTPKPNDRVSSGTQTAQKPAQQQNGK